MGFFNIFSQDRLPAQMFFIIFVFFTRSIYLAYTKGNNTHNEIFVSHQLESDKITL